ncbi:DUF4129 domain-containing protein [Pleomorphovibrio marinus]|uniref:DUF4129 domain-containing protein n=1 Tax=Pleomorphovibrio marinus TaxID=2164132 RepID=UPI000E0A63BB|nr:DUF4129 domain-containing protein [Pleomorphovibrio marinus]
MLKSLFTCVIFLFLQLSAFPESGYLNKTKHYPDTSTTETNKFNRDLYESIRTQAEFSYVDIQASKSWGERLNQWLTDKWKRLWSWIFNGGKATGIGAILMKIIPYLSILLLLVVIFWVMTKLEHVQSRDHGLSVSPNLASEGDLVANAQFAELIQDALKNKNYALALRFRYLHALQLLSKQGLIQWQDQKTNSDYLQEIENPEIRGSFWEITRWYQLVWYGKREMDELLFLEANQVFERFKTLL